jgi:hypothetical protein
MIDPRKINAAKAGAWLFGFFVTFFLGVLIWDTVRDDSGNLVITGSQASGWIGRNGELIVALKHGMEVSEKGFAALERRVICECPKGEIDEWNIPTQSWAFEKGNHPAVTKYFETPLKEPPGSKCEIQTMGIWKPRWAISESTYLLDKAKFFVKAERGAS